MRVASYFSELLTSVAARGFSIAGVTNVLQSGSPAEDLAKLCGLLISSRGEASGFALSSQILTRYAQLGTSDRTAFFQMLNEDFGADSLAMADAAKNYLANPTPGSLRILAKATESPRRELLSRLNQSPDATKALVEMRSDLLDRLASHGELSAVDHDFVTLFNSWFNRGFLELRRIDWDTSAALLEKIIEYEAVHGMAGWDDLRERIDPSDRCIYGFFHPRLGDEPLIFVEVALTVDMPGSIAEILQADCPHLNVEKARTAVFYSISNCQKGLRRVPLGNFLIKMVVEDLKNQFPNLRHHVTLSPLPGFRSWLANASREGQISLSERTRAVLDGEIAESWWEDRETADTLERELLPAAAWYLSGVKSRDERPLDPVARFHLGNGARLERLNWAADISPNGLKASLGIMVNYRYKLDEIEANHERFANSGLINAASAVLQSAGDFGTVHENLSSSHNVDISGKKKTNSTTT